MDSLCLSSPQCLEQLALYFALLSLMIRCPSTALDVLSLLQIIFIIIFLSGKQTKECQVFSNFPFGQIEP